MPRQGAVPAVRFGLMSEEGRKKLLGLAAKVREKTAPSGGPTLDERGLAMVAELATFFGGEGALPGLRVHRTGNDKVRLERPPRNADVWLEWQRPIGALVVVSQLFGNPKVTSRYVHDAALGYFRSMDTDVELYEDLGRILTETLYPEAR